MWVLLYVIELSVCFTPTFSVCVFGGCGWERVEGDGAVNPFFYHCRIHSGVFLCNIVINVIDANEKSNIFF